MLIRNTSAVSLPQDSIQFYTGKRVHDGFLSHCLAGQIQIHGACLTHAAIDTPSPGTQVDRRCTVLRLVP